MARARADLERRTLSRAKTLLRMQRRSSRRPHAFQTEPGHHYTVTSHTGGPSTPGALLRTKRPFRVC